MKSWLATLAVIGSLFFLTITMFKSIDEKKEQELHLYSSVTTRNHDGAQTAEILSWAVLVSEPEEIPGTPLSQALFSLEGKTGAGFQDRATFETSSGLKKGDMVTITLIHLVSPRHLVTTLGKFYFASKKPDVRT